MVDSIVVSSENGSVRVVLAIGSDKSDVVRQSDMITAFGIEPQAPPLIFFKNALAKYFLSSQDLI